MDRYYPGMDKVMRSVFYDHFVNKKIAFRDEDLYEIGLVYFISRFLHSEFPRTFIKKADFDLVESGHYLKYDWGEELEFNLGAIHQDSLGHEHRSNDSDHSVPPITEDVFSVLKNEIVNVRRHMSLFQEKVNSQFNGMREFVEESVKLILNELRFVKQQSSEFNVDVGLQTPTASKKQNEVLVDPVIEKYSFRDDVSVPLDVSNNPVVINPVSDQSPFDDIPFFTESQLVALEPTFRELETPKAHIATPIMFDKSPVGVYNQSDTSSRRCPLYFKSKHPFQEYIGFETSNLLI
ncbi:hypothetical protein FXO38_08568 [Capsicum annuum]|nr:hypothetical protein FXO38_08568 [Capsicum annuum]